MTRPSEHRASAPAPHEAAAQDATPPTQRRAGVFETLRAVAWSFFGIRRSAGYESDVQRLNPIHVIIAGIFSAAVFITLLVVLVRWVVGSGVAA